MVPGKNHHEFGIVGAQDIDVLEHRIRSALIPFFLNALLGGQEFDELVEFAPQQPPAALDMLDQAVRLVLGDDSDAADAGIDAVGKRKIDDPELSAERYTRFRTPISQLFQSGAPASRKNQCHGILG